MKKRTRSFKSRPRADGTVGYGRPPVHSRFKPGQSGNPTGRPSGKRSKVKDPSVKNPGALIWKIVKETLPMREGERALTVSKIEAVLRTTVAKALKGEPRAVAMLLRLLSENPEFAADAQGTSRLEVVFVTPTKTTPLEEDEEYRNWMARRDRGSS
jgi:hypothetical protein